YLSCVVGHNPTEDFVGRKLPSVQEAMSWSQAEIPKCGKDYAVNKLSNFLGQVKNSQKSSKCRRSKTQKQKESNFGQKLKNLFDIAKFINDDQKLFLAGQRSKSRFGLIDNILKSKEIHEDMIVNCGDVGEVESNLLLAAQKSGIV
ncbi:hypothetical protein KQX54_012143, partial [Cotesia glomerata]